MCALFDNRYLVFFIFNPALAIAEYMERNARVNGRQVDGMYAFVSTLFIVGVASSVGAFPVHDIVVALEIDLAAFCKT